MADKIEKTRAEWRQSLTPQQFHVLREKGTEQAFAGQYWNTKAKGIYRCAGCGSDLYSSDAKFDSGTGWPSFSASISPECIETQVDSTHNTTRTELLCSHCGGHLGHLFDDGPAPTGQRHCINSLSLKLVTKR